MMNLFKILQKVNYLEGTRSQKPYIFSIRNDNEKECIVHLFRKFMPKQQGVTIEYLSVDNNITYEEIIHHISFKKQTIAHMQLTGSGNESVTAAFNGLKAVQRDKYGFCTLVEYTPIRNPLQFQDTVSFFKINTPIDDLTFFQFKIPAKTNLQVAMYPKVPKKLNKFQQIIAILTGIKTT